jgi:microsomal dipeptidase-like Zn-dependent dipeptidase
MSGGQRIPDRERPWPEAANHIDHIRKVAGIDHIGLGSDFDGITQVPQGLEDVSKFPSLIAELFRRGYKDDEIKKILGQNILRVMRDVEKFPGVCNRNEVRRPRCSNNNDARRT